MSRRSCIDCGNELGFMERNKHRCWRCRDEATARVAKPSAKPPARPLRRKSPAPRPKLDHTYSGDAFLVRGQEVDWNRPLRIHGAFKLLRVEDDVAYLDNGEPPSQANHKVYAVLDPTAVREGVEA